MRVFSGVWGRRFGLVFVGLLSVSGRGRLGGQVPASETPQTPPSAAPQTPTAAASTNPSATPEAGPVAGGQAAVEPAERHGTVLFQSHGEPPEPAATTGLRRRPGDMGVETTAPSFPARGESDGKAQEAVPDLTDREREAFTAVTYDLDLRLQPRRTAMAMRARLTLRNDGTEAFRRVPLQVSSGLRWGSVAETRAGAASLPLPFAQHTIDSDTDHTGKVAEAIVTLREPLPAGAQISLDVFYEGALPPSTGRLERIGATTEQAAGVDWDGVMAAEGAQATALRGFGNVLWYPVVSPQLFLGSGNELFRAVGAMRRREGAAVVRLRLATEYIGDPPAGVYFCGRRQAFRALSDADDAPVASGTGVAVAEFGPEALGFRTMSLFVAERPELLVAPLPAAGAVGSGAVAGAEPVFSSSATAPGGVVEESDARASGLPEERAPETGGVPMLAVETVDEAALPALSTSAEHVAPLLMSWFGTRPLSALTVLDAPGQPFQDGPVLRAPIATLGASTAAAVLAHSLTAAWVQTGQPWMDEGLAEFVGLLWTEQTVGRPAALAQLAEMMTPVNLAELAPRRPVPAEPGQTLTGSSGPAGVPLPDGATAERGSKTEAGESAGEPLVAAQSELFYRRKAAAVWWMLRDIAGEDRLKQALSAWRTQPASKGEAAAQAVSFERLLERTSGKDLGWFFDDWVLHDRGLPDLTLVDVTPRQLPAGPGHESGWLVAVTVRNDGAAAAEVPLVVRSGSFSSTRRVRVPGFGVATERVLVEAAPTEVLLNDGSTPEVRTGVHARAIVVHGQ